MENGRVSRAVWLVAVGLLVLMTGCSSTPSPVPRISVEVEEYNASFEETWEALNDVLTEKRFPLKAFEKDSGLVNTEFVSSGSRYVYMGRKDDAGREMSQWASKTRYFLNIRVRSVGEGRTTVDVIPHFEYMRYRYDTRINRYVEAGWEPCDSHGDIEQDIYDALAVKLNH